VVNHAQRSWSGGAPQNAGAWVSIPNSLINLTTTGGDLMIQMGLSLIGGSHASCRPIIDGVWAGTYGGLPNTGDPFWQEGLLCVGACSGNWQRWAATRIYPGVPAGAHAFQIQCVTDGATLTVCGSSSVGCYWSVVELK
jgi:hypothetical protein